MNVKRSLYVSENLAIHQRAWQSSTFLDNTGAERAVDGLYTDLQWNGGQCTMSEMDVITAEWGVDLGGVLSIHHVLIQYATDNEVWGTVCFKMTNFT